MKQTYTYSGDHLREIAFPLGGVGTGCVSLDGRGALVDWEIFNKPAKGNIMPMTFPMLWYKIADREAMTRVVQGPPTKNFMGANAPWPGRSGIGHTAVRELGDGLPHFQEAIFTGRFPSARIDFKHDDCPLAVQLQAFSPFVPLDEDQSSLPVASLTYRITNESQARCDLTLAWNLHNGIGMHVTVEQDNPRTLEHVYRDSDGVRGLIMTDKRFAADHSQCGTMAITTDWGRVTHQCVWPATGWYDDMHAMWDMFSRSGAFSPIDTKNTNAGFVSLGLQATLEPGQTVELPFAISWCIPNFQGYWTRPIDPKASDPEKRFAKWTNHYAKLYPDAWAAACHYFKHQPSIARSVREFETALHESTLPPEVIESIGATATTLRTPTCLRYEDGTFWAWEGCSADKGCCEGSCTHVWNYALTQAYVFPRLHRSMRRSEYDQGFNHDHGDEGAIGFRIALPLGSPTPFWHAASDGQLGGIVQLYRDWRYCGDDDYLRQMWPHAKRALEYAWVHWDTDRDGLVDGDQHNTYDINFQGPNPLTQFFYLAALKAGTRIANYLGDQASAREYERVFNLGQTKTESQLFNGEYFEQLYDCLQPDAQKYQHGKGCLSDQVFGQLAAMVAGLGHLIDSAKINSALDAIMQHNFRDPLGDHANMQRIYALADESALLLCTWPRGGRPHYPFPYSDETWTGFEYQVASHLIYEGRFDQAMRIVKGIRHRYGGDRRNPYNEFECGSHYARALSSWGLLLAVSGFRYDAVDQTLTLTPRGPRKERMTCLFTTHSGWGSFTLEANQLSLKLAAGQLTLSKVVTERGEYEVPPDRRVMTAERIWTLSLK